MGSRSLFLLLPASKDVDGRDKPGHDAAGMRVRIALNSRYPVASASKGTHPTHALGQIADCGCTRSFCYVLLPNMRAEDAAGASRAEHAA
jgi:hypothetical protein